MHCSNCKAKTVWLWCWMSWKTTRMESVSHSPHRHQAPILALDELEESEEIVSVLLDEPVLELQMEVLEQLEAVLVLLHMLELPETEEMKLLGRAFRQHNCSVK